MLCFRYSLYKYYFGKLINKSNIISPIDTNRYSQRQEYQKEFKKYMRIRKIAL